MIGHYLLALDTEAEDRILTSRMVPGGYIQTKSYVLKHDDEGEDLRHGPIAIQAGDRCLVGTAVNYLVCPDDDDRLRFYRHYEEQAHWTRYASVGEEIVVEERYDHLCYRFGPERINRAIRDRIWTNRGLRLRMHRQKVQEALVAVNEEHGEALALLA